MTSRCCSGASEAWQGLGRDLRGLTPPRADSLRWWSEDSPSLGDFIAGGWTRWSLGVPSGSKNRVSAWQLQVARRPWIYTDENGQDQIGGFVKEYTNISFLTVKGAGHMVPSDRPRPAFNMFQRFITGQPF
nr:serine carboxypeptidase-like 25 [Zootoca vivipara]